MNRTALLDYLATLLPASPACAEVGVYRGTFSRKILDRLKPKYLLLVDAWRKFPSDVFTDYEELSQDQWDAIHESVCDRFDEPGVRVVKGLSVAVAAKIPDESLDFIYIDANHAHDYVAADLAAWYPKLRAGGVMAGHDYEQDGVRDAVHEFTRALGKGLFITDETSCITYWWRK